VTVSPSAPPAATGADSGDCFHCGLPLPEDDAPPSLHVLGDERLFCCPGCQAVCHTIVEAGLEDYYRYRRESAPGGERAAIPEFLRQLDIYDRDDVQKGFVRSGGHWREAALLLEDIRCPACLWLNERHLRSQPGVREVYIDAATQRMRVRWDPGLTRLSDILRAISAIVPHFEAGQIVSIPRELADTVVTEQGVACLLGKSVRERAEELIRVAHPTHRDWLRDEARRLYWP